MKKMVTHTGTYEHTMPRWLQFLQLGRPITLEFAAWLNGDELDKDAKG